MPRLFQKSKKLKKQKTGRNSQSQSPPVSSVGTQSEPLPLSYHLDSLLNSESPSPQEASRGSYGGDDEVDGIVGQLSPAEIRGPKQLSGRPPPSPTPHPARHSAHGMGESNQSWREEERGLGYSGRWPGHRGVWSPSGSSQSMKEQTYYLPPPLIPSPPLTLTPSPPPPSYTVSQVTMSYPPQPITTPPQLPTTPLTYQHHSATVAPCPANCSLSPPSPFHDTSLTPSIDIVKKSCSTPNTVLQTTPPPKHSVPPQISGSVSESAVVAWNSTLVELGAVLDQRNKEGPPGQGKMDHKGDVPCTYRVEKGLKKWQCEGGVSEEVEEERREEEEIHQCHMALGALQERESRLIDEVAQLQAKLRTESCEEEVDVPIKGSPHPEVVVAGLQETLRQTEQAVQAVQGERDELREGMGRMQEELQSLRRSNSLLAKRKQQWMEVASQVKVVLEENQSLISQYKSQQRAISELQIQYHSRVSALEREMSQIEQGKRAVEFQLKQMKDDQAHLVHQISCLVGISVEKAPQSPDGLRNVTIQLERYEKVRNGEMAAQQERMACLQKENQSLTVRVTEAKAVIRRLEGEMAEVRGVVREGEEAVARLRSQLEEVQDREEATQLQLAHAIAQADKAMAERDTYARIAKRWQCVRSSSHGDGGQDDDTSRALDEARHQLHKREQEHRSQRRRYKTEIHRLRALLASMEENKRHKTPRKERH